MMGGKVVVLVKKKLIWTVVVLVGVMVPLLVASYKLPVEKVTGQPGKMLTYSSDREGTKFNYPQGWLLRSETNYGGEIIETIHFTSPDRAAHGFVQVMVLAKPVQEYLQESQKNMAPGCDSLQVKQVTAGGNPGFLLSYKQGRGVSRTVAAEYFFEKNKKVYRFSYFYPEDCAEKYEQEFKQMLAGFSLPGGQSQPKPEQKKVN